MRYNLTTCVYELVKSFGTYKVTPYKNGEGTEYIFLIHDEHTISLLYDNDGVFYFSVYKFGGLVLKRFISGNSIISNNLYKLLSLCRKEIYANNFPYSIASNMDEEPEYSLFINIILSLRGSV
jgi:hypothetical protein